MTTNLEQIFIRMERRVNRNVKAYKSDFEIDKATMQEPEKAQHAFVWLTRQCGTHLVDLTELLQKELSFKDTYLYLMTERVKTYQVYLIDTEAGEVNKLSDKKFHELVNMLENERDFLKATLLK